MSNIMLEHLHQTTAFGFKHSSARRYCQPIENTAEIIDEACGRQIELQFV